MYRFDIGGGTEGATLQHDVVVTGDAFTVSECSPERQPELTVHADANAYLLCLYNRVDWNAAKRAGRIRVSQLPTPSPTSASATWAAGSADYSNPPLTRTQFVIARSEATWQSRYLGERFFSNEIATLRSQ